MSPVTDRLTDVYNNSLLWDLYFLPSQEHRHTGNLLQNHHASAPQSLGLCPTR